MLLVAEQCRVSYEKGRCHTSAEVSEPFMRRRLTSVPAAYQYSTSGSLTDGCQNGHEDQLAIDEEAGGGCIASALSCGSEAEAPLD